MQINKNILTLTDYEKNLPHHEMIFVEGGEFDMGGSDAEARDNEKPVHRVRVSSFYMGKYPVTQALWQAVMGNNPSNFKGENHPLEQVSWNDTKTFLQKLNDKTDKTYRLPTEAEWEFAARGGIYSEGYLYAGSDKPSDVGWYDDNSGRQTQPVGQKYPNELGLYDLSGNVWEWCEDVWYSNYIDAPVDGSAWVGSDERNAYRVYRGGSWLNNFQLCRVPVRTFRSPEAIVNNLGFRLALSLPVGDR
ncbi:MAG: formylglycine-generating enzyme family protein [Bacteroidia bacterium]|nr:formylglycine-generating enzyme family protein [Bacteroidia bacterium]